MKIYCIKLDAMPFCPEILAIQQLVNGHFARQISGSCSLETACQMLTGRHSSKLEEHGMGHVLWKDKVKDLSKSVGPVETWHPDGIPVWEWIEESLPLILHRRGFKCAALNPFVLSGPFGYVRYPEFYEHVVIPVGRIEEQHNYIQKIQSDQSDMLHMINYGIGHVAVDTSSSLEDMQEKLREACKIILTILKFWDFSEPDSLFWVYSDHGPWRWPILGGYPDFSNFITWAVLRDNTEVSIASLPKVISAQDFFHIVLSKFGEMSTVVNANRICITEDGRHHTDCKKSTTAMACMFENNIFTYLMYHEPEGKFLQRTLVYSDETKDFTLSSESETDLNADLLVALKQNFEWVKR